MEKKVTAFVDESFDQFFNLNSDDGYFCMGIFIVPDEILWDFEKVFLGYRQSLSRELGISDDKEIDTELKSTRLGKIPKSKRVELLKPLLQWANGRDIAVGGFFTTTGGYVNYNIRTEVASEQLDVSDLLDSERIKTAKKDILERRKSTYAESMMIGDVAKVIAGMLLHYCGERDMAFRLRYDPRNKTEDKKVFRQIDHILKPLEKVLLDKKGVYLGCVNDISSTDSCGLQMADFLTRDLRALFKDQPQLLSHGASSDLVTSEVGDLTRTIPTVMGGRVFKWGEFIPMPEGLTTAIFSPDAEFSIANYHELLMASRLSCYSLTGEARIVNLKDFRFETMVD